MRLQDMDRPYSATLEGADRGDDIHGSAGSASHFVGDEIKRWTPTIRAIKPTK